MKKAIFFGFILFFFLAQPALATSGCCSGHGGVSCGAGAQGNGAVICNDGWTGSSCAYSSMVMCGGSSSSGSTNTAPAQPVYDSPTSTPVPARVYPTWTPYPTRKPLPTWTPIPTRAPVPTRIPTPTVTPTPTITMTPSPTSTPSPTLLPTPTIVVKAVVPTPKPQSNLWTWFMGLFGR